VSKVLVEALLIVVYD